MEAEDLIKKIEEKIAELDKQEDANELLKRALLKKGIINQGTNLSNEKIEELFRIIKSNF